MPAPLYLDADSCGRRLVSALERHGFDVGRGTQEVANGAPDEVQFMRAIELGRVIVTANTVDFARLHARFAADGIEHFGVVTWAQERHRSEEAVAAAIAALLHGRSLDQLRNSTHHV